VPGLRSSTRSSDLPLPIDEVWPVVATGEQRFQWYVDAVPVVVRGAVDRLLGGAGRRWDPPGTRLLRHGDRAGFWRVVRATHDGPVRLLVLEAEVRAPGTVRLTTTAEALDDATTRLVQTVTLRPDGLLGLAYLVADLPAREAVVGLAHRHLRAELRVTNT
jgi:hypothetical protein